MNTEISVGTDPSCAGGVAVVSDGSDFHREPGSSVLTELLDTATLLREHTGMEATALLVTADNVEELTGALRREAPRFRAMYLVHTNPARGCGAQAALNDTVPVITDRQTTAVALIASLLTALARAGTAPAEGRVVIAGAQRNPLVAALAVAAGVGEIDSWGPDDAHNFPLRTFARRGAVVIDLLGVAALGPSTPVIAVDEPTTALLALPGLLAAARSSGHAPGVTACLACARSLIKCKPAGQILPALSGPAAPHPHPVRRLGAQEHGW